MISFDVQSNVDGVTGYLNRLARGQIAFATSKALNDTAFDVRKHLVTRTFPRDFKLKNKRFPGVAMRVRKSTKRNLSASVFDRIGRDYLVKQATGGTKRPRGRHIAIPKEVRRTSTGKVSKANQPRALLNKPKHFRTSAGIWKRKGRSAYPISLEYSFVTTARIPKRLRFYEDARQVIQRRFRRRFAIAFRNAKRTAKRK